MSTKIEIKAWHKRAWEDYLYWQDQDKRTLKKINALLKDIERDPYSGIGHPEELKHDLAGCLSREIDATNRMVYRVVENWVEIIRCRGHYK